MGMKILLRTLRSDCHGSGMSADQSFTRAEKLRNLAAYQDALDNAPETVDIFIDVIGATRAQLALWQWQADNGLLIGDEGEEEMVLVGDGSILFLGRMLRTVLTQGRQRERVSPGSAAGQVLFDEQGNWRVDYLARARSALKAVLDALAVDPGSVITAHTPYTPGHAVSAVRQSWGIDQLPRIEWEDGVNTESASRLVDRWAATMCASPIAYEALRNWYRDRPESERVRPAVASQTPPVWTAITEKWPPSIEGTWVRDAARAWLGDMPELTALIGDDAQLKVVLRLAIAKVDAYARFSEGYGGMKIFFQQNVVRPWQGYTMIDLRTPKERAAGIAPRTRDERIVAAVVAMCLHGVINDEDRQAASQMIDRIYALQQPGNTDRPEKNYRARAVANRQSQARLPALQKVLRKKHPAYITQAQQPEVFVLFCDAERLQLAPGAAFADIYISTRRTITREKLRDERSLKVAILADLIANLAIAPPKVQKSLGRGQAETIRAGLQRIAAGMAFTAAVHRNDALSLQNEDYIGAITSGVEGISSLRRRLAIGHSRDRDMLIMEEQLEMNLAGSAVQWVEHLLAGDATWQRNVVPQDQWERFGNFAVHHATNAVAIIEYLFEKGELNGERYHNGFLGDRNFVYRAHDILYRCTGAAAVAALAFPHGERGRGADLVAHLEEIHLGVTTLPHPIAASEMPRLMHSMLLHSFLTGGVLPALQYDNLNASLFDKDFITRVLDADERGDRRARTTMTYDRITLMTDWLIGRNWNAGWIGSVVEGSPVWNVLDERSGGLYSKWRSDFKELLLGAYTPEGVRPSSGDYSFHSGTGKPKDLDSEGAPRISRSDWSGVRDDLIPPSFPQGADGIDE